MDDAVLGHLEWRSGQYAGTVAPAGKPVRLVVDWQAGDPTTTVPVASRAYERFAKSLDGVLRAIAKDMLDLANDWRDDDEGPLKVKAFVARIDLRVIEIWPDQTIRLGFHDGGLFAGHWVEVSLSPALEVTDTNLAG